MSASVLLLIGAGLGVGLALASAAVMLALGFAFLAYLREAEYRVAERVAAIVRDIAQVRAATPPSITPHLDAIEAERAAWALGREKRLAAASDQRFNETLKGE